MSERTIDALRVELRIEVDGDDPKGRLVVEIYTVDGGQRNTIDWDYVPLSAVTPHSNRPHVEREMMSESDESDEAFLKRIEERWSNLHGGQYKQDAARIVYLARRGLTAREGIEKTRAWLADVDVASLPNDFPLDEMARIRMQTLRERTLEGLALIGKAEDAQNEATRLRALNAELVEALKALLTAPTWADQDPRDRDEDDRQAERVARAAINKAEETP